MSELKSFKSLITVSPLGLMYGSAGGFLSPENLVGRSNTKFPPDSVTLAGLLLNANREQKWIDPEKLRKELVVAGPFWAKQDAPKRFYVPISRHRLVAKDDDDDDDEWVLQPKPKTTAQVAETTRWQLNQQRWHHQKKDLDPLYSWQVIDSWDTPIDELREEKAVAEVPWRSSSFLHPKMKSNERHVVDEDGLFLENAVQVPDDISLVYLTNIDQAHLQAFSGWYRLGGEGHLVEVETHQLSTKHKINQLLDQKISHAFALITPGVWGSNKLSYRYPQASDFPHQDLKLLTDKAVPYRYRIGQAHKEKTTKDDRYSPNTTGRLSRGRYAVPVGSVYVFREPLNMTWWDFPENWFPKEGFPLKHLGCGLCLPVDIQGIPKQAAGVAQ